MDEKNGIPAGAPVPEPDDDADIRGGPAADGAPWDDPGWDDPPAAPRPAERAGPDEDGDGADEDPAAMLAAPEGPDAAPAGPARKKKRGRGDRPPKEKGPGLLERIGRRDREPPGFVKAWRGMDETGRQALFTCGCVTAGFCLAVLLVSCTALAFRAFGPAAKPALAKTPQGSGYYYDANGKPHVNVYIQKPETQDTALYVYPDGTVSAVPPSQDGTAQSEAPRTVILYVDADGNVSTEPPAKPEPEPEPEPDRTVLYMSPDGTLSPDKPAGPWREITVAAGPDGGISVAETGKSADWDAANLESDKSLHGMRPSLYLGQDGHVYTSDPGGGERHEIAVADDGSLELVEAGLEPEADPEPEPAEPENPYEGMSEDDILAEARRREAAGDGWFANTDTVYTIRRGDTLSKLSAETGWSVDFLAAYNRIRDKNLIFTGNPLRYPAR